MSEIEVKKITDRAGTGSPNFPHGVEVAGTDSGLLAPTRTEGETAPETPSNGDTFYDTANDTYDVYINDEWKRFIGEGGGSGGWSFPNLSSFSYDSVSLGTNELTGLSMSSDGYNLYVSVANTNGVDQWSLSTPFDLSTATYTYSLDTSSVDTNERGVAISSDGSKLYFLGINSDSVHQYAMSTPYDLSTASLDTSFSVASQYGLPMDVAFSPDGTNMYVSGYNNSSGYWYTLSTAWDVDTASFSGSTSAFTQENTIFGLNVSADGTQFFVCGNGSDTLYMYNASTPFDLTTVSYSGESFFLGAQATEPTGITWSADGSKMYISCALTDEVYQYSTGL